MTDIIYNRGLDDLADWETGDFLWILAQNAYVPDPDHDFVDDITDEVTVASYARLVPTTPTRTVDNTLDMIVYTCDSPDFGDLENTEDARWLILARVDAATPTDAGSPLICALDLGGIGVTLGDDFVVHLHPDGFFVDRQVPA